MDKSTYNVRPSDNEPRFVDPLLIHRREENSQQIYKIKKAKSNILAFSTIFTG